MTAKDALPIDLYFWPTPNGYKISIMLEELAVPYKVRFVAIDRGEQFTPEFLAIAPNNRIPAIVDPQGPDGRPIPIFESGAILMYLGDKYDRFYPRDPRHRVEVNEWLTWQIGGVGPIFGQNNHFSRYADEQIPYAISRFDDETHRLYRVLNQRLEGRNFVAGDYTIADMALFGWIRNWQQRGIEIEEFPHVQAWHDRLDARPAIARALAIEAPHIMDLASDREAKKLLFGQR